MKPQFSYPGEEALQVKGRLHANKWLWLRRLSQLGILALFLSGPWLGYWIVKGNLTSSLTLELLPLTDPYVQLQSLLTGHLPEMTAITGVLIVVAFYLVVGGRVYCSWVCPVNMVTDLAGWLRQRLGIKGSARISRTVRYLLLGVTLLLAAFTGTVAWEWVNPVSMFHRGLIFGMGLAWVIILGVFLFDLFVSRRGWCGHVCPVGAFYSMVGMASLVRVNAYQRDKCDDCMDCFAVCPEPHVIQPALKGAARGIGPVITSGNCTNCGRCIDVCSKEVFKFGSRFYNNPKIHFTGKKMEATS